MLNLPKNFRVALSLCLCLALSLAVLSSSALSADNKIKPLNYEAFNKKLADAKGKVVLVNFFATWCPPCRMEMPSLQRLYKKYPAEHFDFFALSVDEDQEAIAPFLKKMGVTFPVFLCEPDLAERFNLSAIPRMLLYDRNGKLVMDEEGLADEKELSEQVGKLIGDK